MWPCSLVPGNCGHFYNITMLSGREATIRMILCAMVSCGASDGRQGSFLLHQMPSRMEFGNASCKLWVLIYLYLSWNFFPLYLFLLAIKYRQNNVFLGSFPKIKVLKNNPFSSQRLFVFLSQNWTAQKLFVEEEGVKKFWN